MTYMELLDRIVRSPRSRLIRATHEFNDVTLETDTTYTLLLGPMPSHIGAYTQARRHEVRVETLSMMVRGEKSTVNIESTAKGRNDFEKMWWFGDDGIYREI